MKGGSERRSGVAPVVDKNRCVNRAEAGGLIVSGGGVEASQSRHTVVAAGDVVKDRRPARSLLAGESIERGVGVALPGRRVLHHERHHAGKRRRGCRGAANHIERPFLINEIAVVTGRSKRHVGNVALAVRGHARSCLPLRLGINRTRAAAARPKSIARCAFVPDNLWNVTKRRGLGARVIRGRPVQRRIRSIVELAASDTDTVGSRAQAVDAACVCGRRSRGGIAARSAVVSRGNENGDAFGRSLLPQAVQEAVSRGPKRSFTQTEASTHDRSKVVVHDVLRGQVNAVAGIRRLRHDELDGRIFRDRA